MADEVYLKLLSILIVWVKNKEKSVFYLAKSLRLKWSPLIPTP